MKYKVYFISILFLVFNTIDINVGYAQQTAITEGWDYLQETQNPDGSWGGTATSITTPIHSTAVVLGTISYLGDTSPTYNNGLQWLSSQAIVTTEFHYGGGQEFMK